MRQHHGALRKPAELAPRAPQAAPVPAVTPPVSPVVQLQRRLGNEGVQQLFARAQCAAAVSSPHDAAELEAHATARRVVATPDATPVLAAVPNAHMQRAATATAPAAAPQGVVLPPGTGSGTPLPRAVRQYMEPRFRADFDGVRVHTGQTAAQLSDQIGAHAFTVGQHVFFADGKYRPDTDSGRELLAHELTHTIQQGAAVQRIADPLAVPVARRAAPQAQRLGLSDALDGIASRANVIPGFRMLTIMLGVNPVNMSPVERNAANLLRALLELIPIVGPALVSVLDSHGLFAKAGAWAETQMRALGMAGSALKSALDTFLGTLKWSDIFDLGGIWERARKIFTEPIDRLIALGKSMVSQIVAFVREAILLPLAALAEGTNGYDLLKAVLGVDPITGTPVPRNAETLIGGFMKLIGQQEVWENIKKGNAVARTWAWFQSALAGLLGFVRQIPTLFVNAFHALEISDLLLVPRAFAKLAGVFGGFVLDFVKWAGNTVWTLLEIIFEVVSPPTLTYLKKTGGALKGILKDPLPFVRNLVRAAKTGFQRFSDNFGTHLKTGLIDWLTGSLPGVYIPKAFSLGEIVKFVFSVLGLTWQNIRPKLVKVVGETAVKTMETGFDIVVTLVTQGPAAAWEKIQEQLSNLKDQVISGIVDMVIDTVIKKAVPKLISMFIPGAGFISAIVSIYDTIMVFIDKLAKMVAVIKAFVDSIVAIAAGQIDAAAKRVETSLAGLLSLAISFLAGFLGLGRIADKVMGVITRIRATIDKGIDALIAWIVKMAKSLFSKVFGKKDDRTEAQRRADLGKAMTEAEAVKVKSGATEASIRKALPGIQKKYRVDKLELVVDKQNEVSETVHLVGAMSPETTGPKSDIGKNAKHALVYPAAATQTLGGSVVAVGMSVDWLNVSNKPNGSPPGSGVQSKLMSQLNTDPGSTSTDKYVRGHLLNENLGGLGNDQNLFPITGFANSQHLHSTEKRVKNWINDPENWIRYEVNVNVLDVKLSGAKKRNYVNSSLACTALRKNGAGKTLEKFSSTVYSTYKLPDKDLERADVVEG